MLNRAVLTSAQLVFAITFLILEVTLAKDKAVLELFVAAAALEHSHTTKTMPRRRQKSCKKKKLASHGLYKLRHPTSQWTWCRQ